jgi:hypothetical protein
VCIITTVVSAIIAMISAIVEMHAELQRIRG